MEEKQEANENDIPPGNTHGTHPITNNTNTTIQAPHNSLPTTFLTLPRELRQKILIQTYDTNDLNQQLTFLDSDVDKAWELLIETRQKWAEWWATNIGSVDTQIIKDMEWVEEQWRRDHRALLCRGPLSTGWPRFVSHTNYDPRDQVVMLSGLVYPRILRLGSLI